MVSGSGLNGNVVSLQITTPPAGNQDNQTLDNIRREAAEQNIYLTGGAEVERAVNSITISYDSLADDFDGKPRPDTKESHAEVWWTMILGGIENVQVRHNRFGELLKPSF